MTEGKDPASLTLEPEIMRALGYRVVDMLVEHFQGVRNKPASATASRAEMEPRLREAPPEQGRDPFAVLERLERDVFAKAMHNLHPRFFAFVPGPSNFVGAMGDALAAGYNVIAATWLEAAGPVQLELVTIDWLRQICGLPETAGGLFVSGGTMANLTALATARKAKLGERLGEAVIYCSDQVHGSNTKNLGILGFRADQVRKVPSDAAFRLDAAALSDVVAEDRAAGRQPFCVIGTAGSTNTGAVDPLPAIADLCRAEDLWFHIDGAYGAPAVLTGEGKAKLRGLELADSLAIDPHKWLFQPFEIGCVLVRERRWLPQTFALWQEYLQDTGVAAEANGEVNFCDYGVQLTRGFRALKLWLSIQVFGLAAFREAIARGLAAAVRAEALIRADPRFDIVTPAELGIVTFRYRPRTAGDDADALQKAIIEAAIQDGYTMSGTTVLRGRNVLRLCTINPRTTDDDLRGTIELLGRLGDELSAAS